MEANATIELVPAMTLAAEIGIHRRSLARWLKDESLGLPEPTKINGRLYFDRLEIESWKASRIRNARRENTPSGVSK
jgi:predicted DNA-binding transcriptional regulator AlpA